MGLELTTDRYPLITSQTLPIVPPMLINITQQGYSFAC